MNQYSNHTDSLEQFLKETTDSFCMTPNKRVWNSIYNNIHPCRMWPSFTTNTIIVICFLFLQMPKTVHVRFNHSLSKLVNKTTLYQESKVAKSKIKSNSNFLIKKNKKENNLADLPSIEIEINKSNYHNSRISESQFEQNNLSIKNDTSDLPLIDKTNNQNTFLNYTQSYQKIKKRNIQFSIEENSSYVKRKQSYLIQLYATPSFGFLQDNEIEENIGNVSSSVGGTASGIVTENKSVIKPTLNLEAGGAVMMNISRIIRLKAGMQLNYTKLDEIKPSDNSALVSNNPTLINYNPSNPLFQRGNTPSLNTDLFQISVPIGTEIEIMGNDKFRWFAGATIQPSYLINAESTDEIHLNNRDASFGLRKWNLNTSFETYISCKMKNGVILNLGPQFRYQWLSTHNKPLMSGMDKLYNVGLKLGVSRVF